MLPPQIDVKVVLMWIGAANSSTIPAAWDRWLRHHWRRVNELQIIGLPGGMKQDQFTTYRYQLLLAREYCARSTADDRRTVIYFLEDDYFHLPTALAELIQFLQFKPDAVATLYDHPDGYTRSDNRLQARFGVTVGVNANELSRHWKPIESTTGTWAATKLSFQTHAFPAWDPAQCRVENCPEDRPNSRLIWDLGGSIWAPIPSLSSHSEAAFMAPLINWKAWLAHMEMVERTSPVQLLVVE